ncbi:diguanylate cyclase [bacterium]|nr:MAG: diguanylate cyclase [bacterium]
MKIPSLHDASIRTRFIVSIFVMLLPIVVITGVFIFFHGAVVESLDEVVEEVSDEMHPIMSLQILLLSATMPAHDFVIFGDSSEKENFSRISKKVDSAFEETFQKPYELKEEKELIRLAHKEWQLGKKLGQDIFALSEQIGGNKELQVLDRFDSHVRRSVDTLDRTHKVIMGEMKEHLSKAQKIKKRIFFIIPSVFLLGLGIAVFASIKLPRSILFPLGTLEKATQSLASGDLSCRVPLNSNDELGKLSSAFNIMAAKLENAQAALEELATHDTLTDVYNRREFFNRLKGEIKRSLRYGHTFSLMILDLDDFKNVNDTYGHQAGDKVLKTISSVISQEVRPEDILARYGGDEFGLILPETPIANALKLAERIQSAVTAHEIVLTDGKTVKVGLSAGAAEFPKDGESSENLISAADRSLYVSKRSGKHGGTH